MSSDAYQPVDLAAYCNAGVELFEGQGAQEPPLGDQVFHGLPIHINNDGTRAFIAFGTGLNQQPRTIPIHARAYSLIVAHRLLGSEIMAGGPVGEGVATYVVRLSDGSQHRVPIRERFEIADLADWGQLPFLALPDQKNALHDRWAGRWSAAGERQTEAVQGWPRHYYLWRWMNASGDAAIESIEIVPLGPRFLVPRSLSA